MPSSAERLAPILCLLALVLVASCGTDQNAAPLDSDPQHEADSAADAPADAQPELDAAGGAAEPAVDVAARRAAHEAAAAKTASLAPVAPGELVAATDISAAPDGTVYVMDEGASRVVRYDADGALLDMWGSPGTAEGQFAVAPRTQDPEGSQITVGPSGVVFVYDSGNERVEKFTAGGQFYTSWPAHASDMAVSPIGTLFVVDHTDGMIKHYCPAGRLKGAWGEGGEDESGADQCGPYSSGTSYRIAVAEDESVVVADPSTGTVDRCSRTGEHIESWELLDGDEEASQWLGRIALDPDGSLLVTGVDDRPASRYSLSGDNLDLFSPEARARADAARSAPSIPGTTGLWLADVQAPVTMGPDGAVFELAAADQVNVWDTVGSLRTAWGWTGTGAGQFEGADGVLGVAGVAVAPDDTVVVADEVGNRLQRFSATGQYMDQWGTPGDGPGELDFPQGIAVGPDGETYVADSGNHRVQVFEPNGDPRTSWGGMESPDVRFVNPQDVAVLPDGSVAVVDDDGLQLLAPDGALIDAWAVPWLEPDPTPRVPDTMRRRLAIDHEGGVLIADSASGVVWRVVTDSGDVEEWLATDLRLAPLSIAALDDGSVVTANRGVNELQRFDASGEHIGAWPSDESPASVPGSLGHMAADNRGGLVATDGSGALRLDLEGNITYTRGSALVYGDGYVSEAARPVEPPTDTWTLQVFDNPWLTGVPVTTTHVPEMDLDWGLGAPVEDLLPNGWSARLERVLHLEPGDYDLDIAATGAVRVWMCDEIVADLWEVPQPEWSAPFTADGPLLARVEFADRGGPASVRLGWQSADP